VPTYTFISYSTADAADFAMRLADAQGLLRPVRSAAAGEAASAS
jgi:hypothetical protein